MGFGNVLQVLVSAVYYISFLKRRTCCSHPDTPVNTIEYLSRCSNLLASPHILVTVLRQLLSSFCQCGRHVTDTCKIPTGFCSPARWPLSQLSLLASIKSIKTYKLIYGDYYISRSSLKWKLQCIYFSISATKVFKGRVWPTYYFLFKSQNY